MSARAREAAFDPATAKCDRKVYARGAVVCTFHARAAPTEEWVRRVRAESGQRVDWHYVAGYAVVKFIGDRAKVVAAVRKLLPDLEASAMPERFQMSEEG